VSGQYRSALGPQIEAHIAFKRAMGGVYAGGEHYLRRFDAYCAANGLTAVTKEACEGFIACVDAGQADKSRRWISYLRGFARWMRRHGDPSAWVAPGWWTPPGRPEVYVLSGAEVEAFFKAACSFDSGVPWRWQARAFFGVMHSCGLRTGEARRLDRADVDFGALKITVRDSKGPRTRQLPVTSEVAAMLAACDRENSRRWPGREKLFTSALGAEVNHSRPAEVFHRVWDAAGLPNPGSPPFPVPYGLRHRFAYANLERWARSGADTVAMLPYLARYMGHSSPQSTLYYLHISPDFMAGYEKLAGATDDVLPEVGFDA
jgi:integrase